MFMAKFNTHQYVKVTAIGRIGRVDQTDHKGNAENYCVVFPDGRWGWHKPEELEAAQNYNADNFGAEQKAFGTEVARQNWEHRKAMIGWHDFPVDYGDI